MKKTVTLVALMGASVLLAGCSWQQPTGKDTMSSTSGTMMKEDAMTGENMMIKDETTMSGTNSSMDNNNETMMSGEMMKDEGMMKEAGQYEEYNEAAVNAAIDEDKKVVLFFHASRCPSCRSLDKEIRANMTQLPMDTVVFKVNYDSEKELKKRYAVTTQHTLVSIDGSWNELKKMKGGDLSDLITLLQ